MRPTLKNKCKAHCNKRIQPTEQKPLDKDLYHRKLPANFWVIKAGEMPALIVLFLDPAWQFKLGIRVFKRINNAHSAILFPLDNHHGWLRVIIWRT